MPSSKTEIGRLKALAFRWGFHNKLKVIIGLNTFAKWVWMCDTVTRASETSEGSWISIIVHNVLNYKSDSVFSVSSYDNYFV